MNTPEPLKEEEIPQGVIDDLKEHYTNIALDLNSEIDEDTRSLKSNYFDKEKELRRGVVTDAISHKAIESEGHHGKSYLVRVNDVQDGIIVKAVIPMAVFEPVIVIGPVEDSAKQ